MVITSSSAIKMFKLILLIVSLSCVSAGYAGQQTIYVAPVAAHYAAATPSVGYSTATHSHAPILTQAYAHPAPVLVAPVQAYPAPLTQSYAYGNNYAPVLSYNQGYAPATAHNINGHAAYETPLVTKTVAIAQPQFCCDTVWTPNNFNNYHGHYSY
ncbi:uncharacterized protein LOC134223051 [Armigeres subalbatus]|uniref:uncharacterized protein LOC134223051 n=1 Tax=Armigeres subalbatus TaxID=124917 RepID=UPI002ED3675F